MEYDIRYDDPCKVIISVALGKDEALSEIKRAVEIVNEKVEVKGFRKGKAPFYIIKVRFKEEILNEIKNSSIPDAIKAIIDEEKINIIDDVIYDIDRLDISGEIAFTARAYVRPKIHMPDFSDVHLDPPLKPKVDENEIEQVIERIAEDVAIRREKKSPAIVGDLVTFRWDEKPPPPLEEGVFEVLIPKEEITGSIGGQLIGVYPGEVRNISVKYSQPDEKGERREGIVEGRVRILKVEERTIPTDTNEIAKLANFSDKNEMREKVKESIFNSKYETELARNRITAFTNLLLKTKIDIPKSIIEWYREKMGGDDKLSDKKIKDILKRRFVYEELLGMFNIKVSDEELKKEVIERAQSVGESKITKEFIYDTYENILYRKTLAKLEEEILKSKKRGNKKGDKKSNGNID
ncbi:MAG: trigger factor [bacterium]